ncbi:MAG: hypothetical protein KGI79_03010 [Patescibacteria group bacterium]|nr:hypothetical protein [Patescibacteria group bacterium]MDE2116819.1 hypothetical protein [Patescibacteria group bacterium]
MFTVTRDPRNPIISPSKKYPWEAWAAYNWCPVRDGKGGKNGAPIHVAYRALSDVELLSEPRIRVSTIARATSKNGEDFTDRLPFIVGDSDFDKYGCEDPRVTKIDDTYYTFYTALSAYPFSADGIRVAVALSKDMKTVTEKHLVTPWNAKAMALFPERIGGKLAAIITVNTDKPPAEICYVEFDKPEDIWSADRWNAWHEKLDAHVIGLRRHPDDQVEAGAPPIKTKYGWLLIYSHIAHYAEGRPVFGIEAALLDLENPRRIIGRTKGPFMVPETYYELTGFVPRVIFPTGALLTGDRLDIYYGGADTHCARASVSLEKLVQAILPDAKKSFIRFPGNPIIAPREDRPWEANGTFNPAAIDIGGKVHLIYRAASRDNVSSLGYAASKDGFLIDERSDAPIYAGRADFEGKGRPQNAGCEDPRIVEINGCIHMTYTAYDGATPRVAVTSIDEADFAKKRWEKWSAPLAISDPGVPNKDAAILPAEIDGTYMILHRVGDSICADAVSSLDFSKEKIKKCIEIMSPRPGMWDGKRIGSAAPPILTKAGWLLFYHGISETGTYRVGAALLDRDHPIIVKARTALPLLEPQEDYEIHGTVSKVVFPCGVVVRRGIVYLYYGCADRVVSVATARLSAIIDMLTA